jgi:hypothetical protein
MGIYPFVGEHFLRQIYADMGNSGSAAKMPDATPNKPSYACGA